jgi:hypothetical protein
MADEQTPQAGTEAQPQVGSVVPPNTPAAASTPPIGDDMAALPEWAQKQIRELRAESANHRKAKSAAEQQAAQAAEQAAKEQGKWQELATAYEPKAKRADELERYIAETLDAELANVPEKLTGLVPEGMDALGKLRWLQTAKAAGLFAPLQPPRTDAGSGNGQGGVTPARGAMSAERKQELAARYGVRADLLPDTLGV